MYDSVVSEFMDQVSLCHSTILDLGKEGWVGESGSAFYEKFLMWIQEANLLLEKISYFGRALITTGIFAELLQAQYSSIPETLQADSSLSSTIFLEHENMWQASGVIAFWDNVQGTIAEIDGMLSGLSYNKLTLNDLSDIKKQAVDAGDKLTSFTSVYSDYCDNVEAFEAETPSRLGYIMDTAFNYEKGCSTIGWSLDGMSWGLDIAEGTISELPSVFKLPTMREVGKYTIYSNFPKGQYSGRYLTSSLEAGTYPDASSVYRLARGLKTAGKVVKAAQWVLVAVSAAKAGFDEYNRNPYLPESYKRANAAAVVMVDTESSVVGMVVAAETGTALGAWIGSLFAPGPGTAVGAAIGYAIGSGIGYVTSSIINESYNSTRKSTWNKYYDELFEE
jgi:hypothetical protein